MKRLKPGIRLKILLTATLCLALLVSCGDSPETLVKSAKDYLAKRDYRAAVIQLRSALQKAPYNGEARYLLGAALNETHDPAGAEKELRKALELGYAPEQTLPALGRALIEQGETQALIAEFADKSVGSADAQAELQTMIGNASLSLGKSKEAEAAFTAALAAKPGFALAQVGIATLRAASGNIEEATKLVDQTLAQAPQVSEASLLKAELLVSQNQAEAARAVLAKALEAKPDFLAARYLLVSLLIADNDFDRASVQVSAIRQVAKFDVRSYYFEALIATHRGDIASGRQAILQVLKVAPKNVPSLLLAGEIEYRAKQFNQAQDYLQRALNLSPGQPYAQRLLAATYMRTGSPAHALEVLQPALDRGSKDPQLLAIAGEASLANGDYTKAAQYFEQTASLDTKNVEARTRLGQIRFAKGDTEGAIRDLEAASVMDPKVSAADLALIVNLVKRKEFDQALAATNRLEKKQPNSPMVYNLKGGVYLAKQDAASARKSFERALEIEPTYFPAIYNLSRLDIVDKKPELARQRLEAVLKKEPQSDQVLLALADLLELQGGGAAEIESLLKQAVAANSQSLNARVALVKYYAKRRDSRQALLVAQDAYAALPNDPRALELLGGVQQASGELSQAIESFTKQVTLQPATIGPLVHLAGAQVAMKDYDKAIETLRTALGINPAYSEAKREIAAVYLISGRPELALREVRSIQRSQPDDMAGYLLEGDLWASQKKWPESEAAFRAAQKRAPANGTVALKVHASMTNAGKASEANAEIDKWLRNHPKDVSVHAYLGERDIKNKDYKSAARHFQAAVDQQPNNAIFLNNLAWVAGQLDDPKALDYAQKASTLAPESPQILDTLGMLLVKKGDVTTGLEKLEKAVRLGSNRSELRMDLASAYIKAGNKAAARKELETLVQAGSAAAVGKPAVTGQEPSAGTKLGGGSANATPPLACSAECVAEATTLLKSL